MSINVLWEPVATGECIGKVGVKQMLESVYGELPFEVDDTKLLNAMAHAATGENKEACRLLIEAINKHGSIRVFGEY